MSRFVGRDGPLAELRAALEAGLTGGGTVILVGGEPGIGKTRLTTSCCSVAGPRPMLLRPGPCARRRSPPGC